MGSLQDELTYLRIKKEDGALVVSFVKGLLDSDEAIEAMGQELFDLVEKRGFRKIVLSFGNFESASSMLLGKFITLHLKLKRLQGKLIICDVREEVASMLRATKLNDFFEMAETEDEAVKRIK